MATARSCSISALRRTTVRSSSVILTMRWSGAGGAAGLRLRGKAERHGARMGVEALGAGEGHGGGADRPEGGGVAADYRGALHEVEDAEPGGEARAPRGRQDV